MAKNTVININASIIEFDPSKKYLIAFNQELSQDQLEQVIDKFAKAGIKSVVINNATIMPTNDNDTNTN